MALSRIKRNFFEKLDLQRGELLKGAAVTFAVLALGMVMQFLFTVLLGRLLGANGIGLYMLALSIATFTSVVGRLGLDRKMLRFVASHRSLDQQPVLKRGWRSMMAAAAISSLALTLVLFVAAPMIAREVFSDDSLTAPLRVMLLSVAPFGLLTLLSESLRAIERVWEAALVKGVLIPVFSIVFFAVLYAFEPTPRGATLAYAGATLATLGLAWSFWRRAISDWRKIATTDTPRFRETFSGVTSFASVAINQVLIANIDLIIVGFYGTAVEVGIYGAARRLSSLLTFVLTSVNSVLAPKFASLYSRNDRTAMERLGQFSTKLMVALTLPPILLFVAAPSLMMQIFGEEFREGARALVILSLGQLVNVSAGSVCALLLMTGHEREMRRFTTVALLTNAGLCVLLVPRLGINGAAIASASALAILNLLAFSAAVRRVGVSTLPFYSIANR